MKKNIFTLLLISLFGVLIFMISACEKKQEQPVVKDAFNNGSSERNLIVVISDQHLGADISYAEINANLDPLENFLKQIRESRNVKELVIAGDLIDEWFVPATTNTYNGIDQADFVERLAVTNKGVIDEFNRIIQDGKILVTYHTGKS